MTNEPTELRSSTRTRMIFVGAALGVASAGAVYSLIGELVFHRLGGRIPVTFALGTSATLVGAILGAFVARRSRGATFLASFGAVVATALLSGILLGLVIGLREGRVVDSIALGLSRSLFGLLLLSPALLVVGFVVGLVLSVARPREA